MGLFLPVVRLSLATGGPGSLSSPFAMVGVRPPNHCASHNCATISGKLNRCVHLGQCACCSCSTCLLAVQTFSTSRSLKLFPKDNTMLLQLGQHRTVVVCCITLPFTITCAPCVATCLTSTHLVKSLLSIVTSKLGGLEPPTSESKSLVLPLH